MPSIWWWSTSRGEAFHGRSRQAGELVDWSTDRAPGSGTIVPRWATSGRSSSTIWSGEKEPALMPARPGDRHGNGEYSMLGTSDRSLVVKPGDHVDAAAPRQDGAFRHGLRPRHVHYELRKSPDLFDGDGCPQPSRASAASAARPRAGSYRARVVVITGRNSRLGAAQAVNRNVSGPWSPVPRDVTWNSQKPRAAHVHSRMRCGPLHLAASIALQGGRWIRGAV